VIDLAFVELTSRFVRIVAMLSTAWVQNSDFLAVGCGLNDCSRLLTDLVVLLLSETVLLLSETVLVLDGCLSCGDADRGSRRFAEACGPVGRIAILRRPEYEHEQEHRDAEYEKKHETRIGPTCSIEGFSFVWGLYWSHAVNPGVRLL
jgi:hypothetical protein